MDLIWPADFFTPNAILGNKKMVWMAPLWIALTFGQSGQSEEKPTKALPGIDPVWLEKLKGQGPKEIEAYEKAAENLEEESELLATVPVKKDGPLQSKVIRINSFNDGECNLFERTTVVDGAVDTAITDLSCKNADYSFSLVKEGVEKPWMVTGFSHIKNEHRSGAFIQKGQHGLGKILQALEGKGQLVFSGLQWDKEKKLLLAQLKPKTDRAAGTEGMEHEFWLDPANHWCCVEEVYRSTTRGTSEKIKYGQTVEGLLFPTRMENYEWKEPQAIPRLRAEINLKVRKNSLPRSGFYLAAFGLPEPADSEETVGGIGISRIAWFLGGAVLCLVVGLGLWFLTPRGST
jgi:hypothetical protein